MENETRIEQYVNLLGEITQRVGDEAIAARIVSEVAKDRRMDVIREERNGNGANGVNGATEEQPATAKQIGYLKSLGVKQLKAGLTKQEASAMIDELNGQ